MEGGHAEPAQEHAQQHYRVAGRKGGDQDTGPGQEDAGRDQPAQVITVGDGSGLAGQQPL